MDRLVSIGHLSGTAVLKLVPEDEEKDTKIERRLRETEGTSALGTLWRLRLGEVACAHSGQGSGWKGGFIDRPACRHMEVNFRCGFWKWPKNQEEIERNAHHNCVLSSSSGLPSSDAGVMAFFTSISSPKSVQKSVQKIRPKIHPKIHPGLSFCSCDCPDSFCQCQTSCKTSTSSLNVFMGSMAMPREGRLQFYISSREGQIETKK